MGSDGCGEEIEGWLEDSRLWGEDYWELVLATATAPSVYIRLKPRLLPATNFEIGSWNPDSTLHMINGMDASKWANGDTGMPWDSHACHWSLGPLHNRMGTCKSIYVKTMTDDYLEDAFTRINCFYSIFMNMVEGRVTLPSSKLLPSWHNLRRTSDESFHNLQHPPCLRPRPSAGIV